MRPSSRTSSRLNLLSDVVSSSVSNFSSRCQAALWFSMKRSWDTVQIRIAECGLRFQIFTTADCQLKDCRLPIKGIADCQLPIADLRSPSARYSLKLTCHLTNQSSIVNRQSSIWSSVYQTSAKGATGRLLSACVQRSLARKPRACWILM